MSLSREDIIRIGREAQEEELAKQARGKSKTNGVDHHPPAPQVLTLRYGWEATQPVSAGTIVQGLLHAGSLTLFYGPPKSGKSFLVTDLFLAIASTADSWMGHDIRRHGPVLYIACEGHTGFWKRLRAAARAKGWDKSTFPSRFILASGRPTLIQFDGDKRAFVPHPDDILAAIEQATAAGMPPVAIAVDTVFRSFGSGTVNASDHMNAYLAALAQVLDRGIAVAAVHHEIKSGGTPAGSVTLTGGADTVIHVAVEGTAPNRCHSWQIEMAKDDAETELRAFSLVLDEDVGFDPDGYIASSCVVRDDGAAPEPKKVGRPANQAERDMIFRFLFDALAEHGERPGIGVPDSIPRVVHVDRWRDEFYRRARPDDAHETKKKAFQRLIRELQAQERIGVTGKHVWPVTNGAA